MLIKSLHLKSILSFKDTKLDLQPLNVLIGPNGSGKSNLIDVIALLQAVPGDLPAFLRRNGPTGDWVWNPRRRPGMPASLPKMAAVFSNPRKPDTTLQYELELMVIHQSGEYYITSERLASPTQSLDDQSAFSFFNVGPGLGMIATEDSELPNDSEYSDLILENARTGQSVFGEIRDLARYPTITRTARQLSSMRIYGSWYVGRNSPVRHPQRTDGDPNFLAEDFSNLALVVNDLLSRRLEPSLNDYLQRFYESYESLHPRIYGNTIELIVNEAGMSGALPASRLSDGTIRFIALLAILCHPEPPPLICIEEPEIAMHPDSLGLIADLLRKASERTQIIVTTHSPELVSLFPPEPEAEYVVVCDRDAAKGTRFHRPSYADLREWQDGYQQTGKELVVYGLSEMWLSGAIGGVR